MKRVLLAVWLLLATGSTVLQAQTGGAFAPGGQQLVLLDFSTFPGRAESARGYRQAMSPTRSWRSAACAMTAAWVCLPPATASGQGRRMLVSYDVECGTMGSLLDSTCPASGTDVLAGTLAGMEPALPDEPNEYVGTLTRTTRISICGSRRTTRGEDVVCSINISGNGFADVKLTVEADQRGGWLQYLTDRAPWDKVLPPRPSGRVNSTVTGTCDPAELGQLQAEYDAGQTAASPSGQPIEISGFPPSAYPFTFQAKPPISIWSLKVLRRRP